MHDAHASSPFAWTEPELNSKHLALKAITYARGESSPPVPLDLVIDMINSCQICNVHCQRRRHCASATCKLQTFYIGSRASYISADSAASPHISMTIQVSVVICDLGAAVLGVNAAEVAFAILFGTAGADFASIVTVFWSIASAGVVSWSPVNQVKFG